MLACLHACVRACVCACACVRLCVCACVRLCDTCVRLRLCSLDKTSSTEPSAHARRSPASHTTSTPGNGSAFTMVHPAAGLVPPRHSLMGPGRELGGLEAKCWACEWKAIKDAHRLPARPPWLWRNATRALSILSKPAALASSRSCTSVHSHGRSCADMKIARTRRSQSKGGWGTTMDGRG